MTIRDTEYNSIEGYLNNFTLESYYYGVLANEKIYKLIKN